MASAGNPKFWHWESGYGVLILGTLGDDIDGLV